VGPKDTHFCIPWKSVEKEEKNGKLKKNKKSKLWFEIDGSYYINF